MKQCDPFQHSMNSCLNLLSDWLSAHAKGSNSLCVKMTWNLNKSDFKRKLTGWVHLDLWAFYEHLKITCTLRKYVHLGKKKEMLPLFLEDCLRTDVNACVFDSNLVKFDKRWVLGLPGNYKQLLVLYFRKKSSAYDVHWLWYMPTSL